MPETILKKIERLTAEITGKIEQLKRSLDKQETFEIARQILRELREMEKELKALQEKIERS